MIQTRVEEFSYNPLFQSLNGVAKFVWSLDNSYVWHKIVMKLMTQMVAHFVFFL